MRAPRSAAALLAIGLVAAGCAQGGNEVDLTIDEALAPEGAGRATVPVDGIAEVSAVVAEGLTAPSAIAFLPDGRAVVTERVSGRVLLLTPPAAGTNEATEPVVAGTLPGLRSGGGAGLLGVAVSPDFADDELVYFYLTTAEDNRVVRATLSDDELGEPEVLLSGIPAAGRRNGGALLFAEDGTLFVGTGDANRPPRAQRRGNMAGKVLRITTDGEPAGDNPFAESVVWSLGHRSVEGLALDADGNLWASETGGQTADEINLIEARNNYGWPRWEGPVEVDPTAPGPDDPAEPAETLAPQVATWSGIAWSRGFLWVAAGRGQQLWRINATGADASDPRGFLAEEYGRLRALALAPDGRLWVGTDNPSEDDASGADQVLLINP